MTETQQLLRELRSFHNKTLAEVSAVSGLSISYLSDLERGVATPMDSALETLNKILSIYNLKARIEIGVKPGEEAPHTL